MKKYIPHFILVLIIIGWAVFINRAGDQFIYDPSRNMLPLHKSFQEINFPAKNGQNINAVYLPARPGRDTILFFHGNSYNLSHFQDFALRYAKYGYGVFIFDYRGYGKSEGKQTERRMYNDGNSALNYLLYTLHIPPQEVILWGFSLGNAVAVQTVLDHNRLPFKALILQSPFSNTPQMGYYLLTREYDPGSLFQQLIARLLSPVLFNKRFDNVAKIGKIRAPILIGYSMKDRTIPWQMSQDLALHAPKGSRHYLSPTGGHTDFDWFEAPAVEFLKDLDPNRPPHNDGF